MPNRLINETSPYLLQHANNPVDWYPWGPEALNRAQQEDRPILLSIGYSACHWCHVMERESFENTDIAKLMNELFVCIKVDREERPDLDGIYMQAVQAMTGQGGWPLTIFLTPERIPFFGGTYFPPDDRHGIPGFHRILHGISKTYQEQKTEVAEVAKRMFAALKRTEQAPPSSPEPLTLSLLDNGYQAAHHSFEPSFGGFGNAPKFPNPMLQEMLLRHYHRTGEPEALQMVEKTLQSMANGGIYDHLGGGFHRYSTDARWLVPHFEKMLYDNALLSRLYLHAYQITGDEFYRQVVEETLDYVLRDMTDCKGGFFSTQDADSEGIEGKFYLWDYDEITATLGAEEAQRFCQHYNISEEGNFEQRNILHVSQSANRTHQTTERQLWSQIRKKLLEVREKRIAPEKDTKVLTAWNGMMLRSLAEAAAMLQRPDYLEAATRNASFLLSSLWIDNRLLRTWKDGRAKLLGYLEDYAFLINGLLSLYEATFDMHWIDTARKLGDSVVELFWDPVQEIFYDTGKDHEELLIRPREITDGATPSGGAVAAEAMLRLSLLTGNDVYRKSASTTLRSMNKIMETHPTALTYWLGVLDFYLSTPKEIAIIGSQEDPATNALLQVLFQRFQPNRVIAGSRADTDSDHGIPLLESRTMLNGEPTAYVCENYTCKMPVTEPKDLESLLESPTILLL